MKRILISSFALLFAAVSCLELVACSADNDNDNDDVPATEADAGADGATCEGNCGCDVCNEPWISMESPIEEIALDAAAIYFVVHGIDERQVRRAPLAGGPSTVLATVGETEGLTVSGGRVYWLPQGPVGATVASVATVGGPVVDTIPGGQFGATTLASDATSLYWAADGKLMKSALDGSQITTLASPASASTIVAQQGYLFFFGAAKGGVAEVHRMPTSGGTPQSIYEMSFFPAFPADYEAFRGLAVAGSLVYVGTLGNHILEPPPDVRTIGSAGNAHTLAALDAKPLAIAADDSAVYIATEDEVLAFDRNTGEEQILSRDWGGHALALDNEYLYVASGWGIRRLEKQ